MKEEGKRNARTRIMGEGECEERNPPISIKSRKYEGREGREREGWARYQGKEGDAIREGEVTENERRRRQEGRRKEGVGE